MNARVLSFLLFLAVPFFLQAHNPIDSSTETERINGQVKTIKEVSYRAVEEFDDVYKGKRDAQNPLETEKHLHFNENGRLLSEVYYKQNGQMHAYTEFIYDENGLKTEENRFKSDSSLSEKVLYTYNDQKQQETQKKYKSDGSLAEKTRFEYDENGRLVSSTLFVLYNADNVFRRKTNYRYNKKDQLIEGAHFNESGKPDGKWMRKYDEAGNIIEQNTYNSDGSSLMRWVYTFDEKGNKTSAVLYDYAFERNENAKRRDHFRYEYDEKGNWIEKVVYQNEVIPKYVIEREIEYF